MMKSLFVCVFTNTVQVCYKEGFCSGDQNVRPIEKFCSARKEIRGNNGCMNIGCMAVRNTRPKKRSGQWFFKGVYISG